MSYSWLLAHLGFAKDSFAKTNADEEDNLNEYFVPPLFSPLSSVIQKARSLRWYLRLVAGSFRLVYTLESTAYHGGGAGRGIREYTNAYLYRFLSLQDICGHICECRVNPEVRGSPSRISLEGEGGC
jgi:hypothetical protein